MRETIDRRRKRKQKGKGVERHDPIAGHADGMVALEEIAEEPGRLEVSGGPETTELFINRSDQPHTPGKVCREGEAREGNDDIVGDSSHFDYNPNNGHLRCAFSQISIFPHVTSSEKLTHLLEYFAPIEDPQERLSLLVEQAASATLRLPEQERTDERRIQGCVSAAWVSGELIDGKCHFRCAADSPLVAGLLACLCSFFSDLSPAEVASSKEDPLESLGLKRNLSPTRQNGLAHARTRIQTLAQMLGNRAPLNPADQSPRGPNERP